jgi:hypothetical protein
LLGSACNNHQRIVRALLEDQRSLPDYDVDGWVSLHGYQNLAWGEIVERSKTTNQHLISAARFIALSDASSRRLTVGGKPGTLELVVEDYIRHLLHHVHHIGAEVETVSSRDRTKSIFFMSNRVEIWSCADRVGCPPGGTLQRPN